MPRLHSERSRPYPGRPVRYAIQLPLESAMHGNMPGSRAGVSRGHSSSPPANEGPNPEKGKDPSCSTNAMNPTGGAVGRRVDGQPDPDEYLLERILSRANLSEAWKRVKANRGAPGVDDMPIDDFMAYAWEHWPAIRSSIFANSYKPLPVKRVEIPKATGGTRPLGIPSVLDRLIQQVSADSEPLLRYWCRSLILVFRRQVLASVRGCRPTMPCTRSVITSARDTAWLSIATWQSFSTRWSTMCSWPGSAKRCVTSAS